MRSAPLTRTRAVTPRDDPRRRRGVLRAIAWSLIPWIITAKGRPIGNARLRIDGFKTRCGVISLGIWEDADRGAGHGTEALRLILTHSFDHLDLHCIELRVLARNAAAICCYWKCGFVEEGRERHTASLEGE
jgi:RimJ/RimL family protein N-acetyltransferase